jgi:proprotein convertase subtilisin/kexin type 5
MCQSPCSTCVFRADYCIKCVSGYYIYNGTCQKTCPQGTYINSGICETCPYPCLTCLNQVVCMSCFGGFLNYLNATCIAGPTCPNEMYNLDGVACIKASDCPANYFKDTQALTCTSKCNLGKYTYVGNSSCLNLCPSDYFAGVDLICSNYLNLGNR